MHLSTLLISAVAVPTLAQYAAPPQVQVIPHQVAQQVQQQQQVNQPLSQQQVIQQFPQQQVIQQIPNVVTNGMPVFNANGVCVNNQVVIPNTMLQTWGIQWRMSVQQVGQLVTGITALPPQINILLGCRQLCQVHNVPMTTVVQVARACRTHIIQNNIVIVQRPQVVVLNTVANVFIQMRHTVMPVNQPVVQQQIVVKQPVIQQQVVVQQPVVQQQVVVQRPVVQQQVVVQQQPIVTQAVCLRKVVIVQPAMTRVQTVCNQFGITPANANWMSQYVMGNMVNWGCCGLGSTQISKRDDADTTVAAGSNATFAETMANDAEMQGDMATVLEMFMGNTTMLANATISEAMGFVKDAAKSMEMSELIITNMCGAAAAAMLQSNTTDSENLHAMVNCATAKTETFIDPVDLGPAADARTSAPITMSTASVATSSTSTLASFSSVEVSSAGTFPTGTFPTSTGVLSIPTTLSPSNMQDAKTQVSVTEIKMSRALSAGVLSFTAIYVAVFAF
ncbi:hypothetical protein BC830DRAFT_1215083 [Chytriomyces sp. MP71]|nr:hypothetical protein BC830DRAFT_1215083 [Chytriomyces sp. MP71]